MIQKNTDAEVQEHTAKAASIIKDIHRSQSADVITSTVETALKEVCNLKGVGPATGTLVLSVFKPKTVPFFEDELFFCLHPDHAGKLKYDKAEYKSLLSRALDIVLNRNVEAQALEKTAYVLMNADKLSQDDREQLKQSVGAPATAVQAEKDGPEAGQQQLESKDRAEDPALARNDTKQARVRRKAESQEDTDGGLRRSKRRKA